MRSGGNGGCLPTGVLVGSSGGPGAGAEKEMRPVWTQPCWPGTSSFPQSPEDFTQCWVSASICFLELIPGEEPAKASLWKSSPLSYVDPVALSNNETLSPSRSLPCRALATPNTHSSVTASPRHLTF